MSGRARFLPVALLCLATLSGCDLFVSANGHVARAREDVKRGDYPTAVIELKNALESDPDNVPAHVLLAEVSLHLGDAQGADKELRRAHEAGASSAELAELTARTRLALGQAKELLEQIGSRDLPLEEPARSFYRGQALLMLGQIDAAADAFSAATAGSQKEQRAVIGLARARAMQGRTDESVRLLDDVLAETPSNAQALLARGQILAARGRFTDAMVTLRTALDQRGQLTAIEQAALLAALGEASLATGDLNAARQHVKALLDLTPNAPITLLLSARIAMAQQDYATATAALQRVVVARPDFAAARFLLGASLVAQGNLNQAESQLERAVQAAPDNLEGRKLLAQVRLRMGQPDAVVSLLTPLQSDADPDVNTLLGLAQMQLGDSSRAVSSIERGAAGRPNDRKRQLGLAATYLQAVQYQKAITLLRGIPHVEGDAHRESLLVTAVAGLQGVPAGDAEMNGLLAQYPRDLALLNASANMLAQRNEHERARALVGRALAVKADDPATLMTAARIEFAAGDINSAKSRLQGLVAAQPNDAAARMGLAEILLNSKDLRGAAAAIEPLRAHDATAIEPRLALARIYLMDRRTKEAADVIRELDNLANDNAAVVNAVGTLYLASGRYDEAATNFNRAIKLDGANAQYWFNQARAQLALDRRAQARESLEHALQVRPDSPGVVAALAMLDVREGKSKAGAERIAALRKVHPDDPTLLALEGDFHAANRDYEAASQSYDAALRIRPTAAVSLRAYAARRDGKLRDATAPLEQWVDKQPDDFGVQAVLAQAYVTGGRVQRAIEKYELITQKGPPNALVLNNLAWLYYEQKDPRAESVASRAYFLEPNNISIADTYGWILIEHGKVTEGMKILGPVASRGDQEIQFHYAAGLARAGDIQGARTRLKSLVEGPDFNSQGDARRLLQELSTR